MKLFFRQMTRGELKYVVVLVHKVVVVDFVIRKAQPVGYLVYSVFFQGLLWESVNLYMIEYKLLLHIFRDLPINTFGLSF